MGDRPGYVNIIQYELMPDPKEAAVLLLREAAIAQSDIDRIGLTPAKPTILVASGLFTPDLSDDSFVRYANEMASKGFADADTVCLVKLSRGLSIRETAAIMALGVRLYRDVPSMTYIAGVPFGVAASLLEMPVVEWIGVFEPRQKIKQEHYVAGRRLFVETLIGDEARCRADLTMIGAQVEYFSYSVTDRRAVSRFELRLDRDRLNELAAFWWVMSIRHEHLSAPHIEVAREPSRRGSGATILATSFRPYDSRRLLSLRKTNNLYDGDGETLTVLDFGTWWDHPALRWRALPDPISNASVDSLHGTFVSGIAVGEWNGSVNGGGIGGVAPRARLVSRARSQTSIAQALEMGLKVANFSFGSRELGAPVLTYDDAASLVDDNSDDEHDVLVVVSAGNAWDPETIEAPALAKNALAVGAINYVPADTTWEFIGRRSDYSSQGPTEGDRRLKPDLVAPGGSAFNPVVSCKSPCCTGSGVWYSPDGGYVFGRGTSAAAPHVAGAALIVEEWYKAWTQSRGLDGVQNYTRTSELMRALLINTAIPLRLNGDSDRPFPRYASDNAATAETLKGFANTEYGFGLVNPYSGVLSPESDYWRALLWQDEVINVLDTREQSFNVADDPNFQAGQPRYIVATMVYDDVAALADDEDPLKDKLEFSLVDPTFVEHKFALPFPLKAGTVQKIIIPNPSIQGSWKAKVFFAETTLNRADLRQRFAVVVDVMEKAPRLSVVPTVPSFVKSNTDFNLPVKITNIGGNVAAGVTVILEDPDHCFFPGSADTGLFYLGNLVKGSDSITRTFKFHAPYTATARTCSLIVKVDTINKMMDGGPYPIRTKVLINVRNIQLVKGQLRMLPGFSANVASADILVNGIASGVRSAANGTYQVEVERNFSGTIRPRKGTSVFFPPSRSYASNPVTEDRLNQDYEASFHTVSGIIRDDESHTIPGIIVTATKAVGSTLIASSDTTDANGFFSIYVEHGWTGTLTPQPNGQYATFNVENAAHAYHDSIVTNVSLHDFRTRPTMHWPVNGLQVTNSSAAAPACVMADGVGGLITVWTDERAGSANADVYAQRQALDGGPMWGGQQLQVCGAVGIQDSPSACRLADGSVFVVWRDYRSGSPDLYAQRLALDGAKLWSSDGIVVCSAAGAQRAPQSLTLADGSVLVAWEDERTGTKDIYAQRISADGTLLWSVNGIATCSEVGDQSAPRVQSDGVGGAYFAWDDRRQAQGAVFAQRVSSTGVALWSPSSGVYVGFSSLSATSPSLAASSDGGCLIASLGSVRKFRPDGTPAWPGAALLNGYAPVQIISDGTGGAIVAWKTYLGHCGLGGSAYGFRIQRLDAAGTSVWTPDGRQLTYDSDSFGIVEDGAGGAYVCWREWRVCSEPQHSDVRAQRLNSTGSPYWATNLSVCSANGTQDFSVMASDLVSGCFIAWRDRRQGINALYSARVNDTPLIYPISGSVKGPDGVGVANVLIHATDGYEKLVSGATDGQGNYSISLPAFWRGDLVVEPRGYLNTVTPSSLQIGPVTSALVRDFAVFHTPTAWLSGGLGLDTFFEGGRESITTSEGSDVWIAWENTDLANASPVRIQRLTPTGDIQWTSGGDPVGATSIADARVAVVSASAGKVLQFWRSLGTYEGESSVWGSLISASMLSENKIRVSSSVSTETDFVVALSDGEGGAFVTWYDRTEEKLFLQRVGADGNLLWANPIHYGFGFLECPPLLRSDGFGGALLCWQLQFGGSITYLNVQRIDASGNTLWGGPDDWTSVTIRWNAHITPGSFRLIGDGGGGAYVAWNEQSGAGANDDRIRVNWVDAGGNKHLGAAGVELTPAPGTQQVADVARPVSPWSYGFLLLYIDTPVGTSTRKLQVQQVLPGIDQFLARGWGDNGVTVAADPVWPPGARMLPSDASGGAVVVWTSTDASLYAQCIDSTGTRAWVAPSYKLGERIQAATVVNAVSDGSSGAYITWRDADMQFKVARLSESVLSGASISISTFVRNKVGVVSPISERHANGCPKGDEDDLVFRVELKGELTVPPPASSISLVPHVSGSTTFFRTETADSSMRLSGDCYQTTITASEFAGCGEDSAEVRINNWVVGHAYFSTKSPDLNSSSEVDLSDFATFGAVCPSSRCNCFHTKPYDRCADFLPSDTTVNVVDFGLFGSHNDHVFDGGQNPVSADNSGGTANLLFEELVVNNQRTLRARVVLSASQPFVAGYIALRNENPRLAFLEWKQNPSYQYLTLCTPVVRDGRKELALGMMGSKQQSIGQIELGWIDLAIASNDPFELTDDDLGMVTAKILDLGGNALGVSINGRNLRIRRYDNWLQQNYPNPFNPTTTISFSLSKPGQVTLRVYDVRGSLVKTLVNGNRKPNQYAVVWDGVNNDGDPVASGVYFYKLNAPGFSAAKKMVLLK